MELDELPRLALQLNARYEQLEHRRRGRAWTVQELARPVQAHAGVRDIDGVQGRLGHELSDCLWSILVLADKCGIDLEAVFIDNMRGLIGHVSVELEKAPGPGRDGADPAQTAG